MSPDKDDSQGQSHSPMKLSELAGVGAELGGIVAVLCLGGWWLDRQLDSSGPWFLLTGAFIGILGGLYRLFRVGKRFFNH